MQIVYCRNGLELKFVRMELTGGVVNVYSRKVNFLYGKCRTQVLTAWTDLEYSAISQLALVRLEREEQ